MNITEINTLRKKIGLEPITVKAKANNQAKNLSRRAQESRDLKAKRTGKR